MISCMYVWYAISSFRDIAHMYIRVKFMEREPVKYCLDSVKGRGGGTLLAEKNANSFLTGSLKNG